MISYADSFSDNVSRNTLAYPTTVTDPDGYSSTSKYHFDFGAVTYTRTPQPNVTTNTAGPELTFTFDTLGRLDEITNSVNAASTRFVYTLNENRIDTYRNIQTGQGEARSFAITDGHGRIIASAEDHPSVEGYSGRKVVYDIMGRVFKSSNPTDTSATGAPSQWTAEGDDQSTGWIYTEQTYDWKGRPLVTTNQDGTTRTASYSGCGCAGGVVVTLADEGILIGGVTKKRQRKIYSDVFGRPVKTEVLNWEDNSVYLTSVNTYDVRDQITLTREYEGTEESGTFQDTTMTYDGFGRLQSMKVPEQSAGTSSVWSYNSDDTVNSITDARGALQAFTYNGRHLTTGITYAAPGGINVPSSVTYAYDAAGNRMLMTDGHGSQTYQYDLLSRLTQETRQFAVGTFSIGYTYNLVGQLMSVTDPFNDSISYTRNQVGQLKTVTGSVYAGTSSYITDVSYRAWGAPKSISYPSTTATTAYNARLLPTQYRHTANSSGASIMREDYGYFPDGKLASLTDLDDTPGSNPPATLRFLSRLWQYDQMSRVIHSNGTGSGSMPGVPYTQSYTYDAFGNMTSRVGSYYNYTFQPPSSDTATYTNNRRSNWSYNADGEVVSTPLTNTDQPRTMTYDAAGRMLTSVETGQSNTITYSVSYDGDGQVVFESSNTSPGTSESSYIVRSTVLGGDVLTRLDQSGNKKSTHVPAEGFLFATQRSSGAPGAFVEFTHRNPHEVTETSKAVYDPLGNYMPFQASGDPRPPAGSFTSATMRGLSASQANPYSSAVGCLMDGLPARCVSVAKAVGRGEAKKLIIDGRGQNPNVALGNMGWFLVEFPTDRKIAPDRPRLSANRRGPKPDIKDPYKIKIIDQEVNWAVRLISFQPQNPVAPKIPVSEGELEKIRSDVEKAIGAKRCADYLKALLDEAAIQTGEPYRDIMVTFDNIKFSYQADGGFAFGSFETGTATATIRPFESNFISSDRSAFIRTQTAQNFLGETLHHVGTHGAYRDAPLANALNTVLVRQGLETRQTFTERNYSEVTTASNYWHQRVYAVCGMKYIGEK